MVTYMNSIQQEFTYKQRQQLQRRVDSAPQNLHPCIVPSCGYHKDAVIFETDLPQSKCSQCKSVNAKEWLLFALQVMQLIKRMTFTQEIMNSHIFHSVHNA